MTHKVRVTPTISADRKYVRLKLEGESSDDGKGIRACEVMTTVADGGTTVVPVKRAAAEDCVYLVVTTRVLTPPEMLAPAVYPQPILSPVPAQGVALSPVGYQHVHPVAADRKEKAAEWVRAYERACAGAPGPSPAECAMRALAEDPHCFARTEKK
jgi:hypothetical protein